MTTDQLVTRWICGGRPYKVSEFTFRETHKTLVLRGETNDTLGYKVKFRKDDRDLHLTREAALQDRLGRLEEAKDSMERKVRDLLEQAQEVRNLL